MYHLKSGLCILMMMLAASCSKCGSVDQEQTFERHIPLSDRWIVTKMVQDRGTVFYWRDSMYVEYNEEKVYLLDVNSAQQIQSFRLNGSEVSGYEESIQLISENKLPFESIITAVEPLENIQKLFESIDENPNGMKYLIDCQ